MAEKLYVVNSMQGGHSNSTCALEGREGVPEKRTTAYKGGGCIQRT